MPNAMLDDVSLSDILFKNNFIFIISVDNLLAIDTIEANDQPAARKLKYAQLRTHHNPFAFGR
jgi:uncharacterized membrane protein